ncbi:hypothetical protein [Flagellimonas sp.]|uniref:hypothetical protein n=1 Tax=Flagellimonas sp. TaxID=2058762 RepID=UPI003F4A3C55
MKLLIKATYCCVILMLVISCNIDDGVEGAPLPNFDVLGLWDLVAVNVNPPQDINMDGTASTNLMDELECISGSLLIDSNLVWTYEQSIISVSTITGDLFSADCNGTITGTGNWFSDETGITFTGNDEVLTELRISGDQLINEVGEDLPGIQSFVYGLRQF